MAARNLQNLYVFKKSKAQVIIFSMVFLAVMLVAGASFASYSAVTSKNVTKTVKKEQALSLAEGGINKAMKGLAADADYAGETFTLGDGTVVVSVTSAGGGKKKITSIGEIKHGEEIVDKRTVEVLTLLDNPVVDAPFHYGILAGVGGVLMGNNSMVSGSVYSNGSIIGASGAKITGDAFVADDIAEHIAINQSVYSSETLVGDGASTEDWMQSFTMTEDASISKVQFFMKKIGTPNSTTIAITSDNNGRPGTTLTSASISVAGAPTDFAWHGVTFANKPLFYKNKKYWIVINVSSASATKYWVLKSTPDSTYADGTTLHGSEWNIANPISGSLDFAFNIYTSLTNIMNTVTVGQNHKGTAKAPKIQSATIASMAYAKTVYGSVVGDDTYVDRCDYGTVGRNVYYHTANTCTTGGSSIGEQSIPTLPGIEPMPIDADTIDGFKEDAHVNVHEGDYSIVNGVTEWLGPIEITGNLNVENNATLIVQGTIYVQGTITLSNNCIINLSEGYNGKSGVIVTDGLTNVSNNCTFGSLTPGGHVVMISTDQSTNMAAPSFSVSNNADTVIFYAPFGSIKLSNNVHVKEATASIIKLENNAVVEYDTGLANLQISSGPAVTWSLVPGSWRIVD